MSGTGNNNPGNFANRPTEEVREIAAKGGRASHATGSSENDESNNQGSVSNNPGNFANRYDIFNKSYQFSSNTEILT